MEHHPGGCVAVRDVRPLVLPGMSNLSLSEAGWDAPSDADDPLSQVARKPSSLADELVDELASFGIDTYFGVPGGAIEPLFNVLARRRLKGTIQLVAMRGEAGAAFAADGYYRASGRMAVCTATTGP